MSKGENVSMLLFCIFYQCDAAMIRFFYCSCFPCVALSGLNNESPAGTQLKTVLDSWALNPQLMTLKVNLSLSRKRVLCRKTNDCRKRIHIYTVTGNNGEIEERQGKISPIRATRVAFFCR